MQKDLIIQGLITQNDSLLQKHIEIQKVKLELYREKQIVQDLFSYYNEKATKIFLMNENLAKVIKENKKLKRFIEEIYHSISDSVLSFQKDILESKESLGEIQNEMVFAFINAKTKGP